MLCQGKVKLGEDHPDTWLFLSNLAMLLQAQGHLEDAEPLLRDDLKKCQGAQLQRDLGHTTRSHSLFDFRLVSAVVIP